ncbi:MAG: hypothetical protein IT453_05605 [Planctomycetes bacterium]|nr:hypothetical protein [Planctomycetota bacterium]
MQLPVSTSIVLALCALLGRPLVSATDSASAGVPPWTEPSLSLITWACGEKSCNCTDSEATLSICDTDSVTVTLGGSPLTVATGHTSSSCASQKVPGGTCIWKCYKIACTSFLGFWSCSATGADALKNGPAGSGDCPPR